MTHPEPKPTLFLAWLQSNWEIIFRHVIQVLHFSLFLIRFQLEECIGPVYLHYEPAQSKIIKTINIHLEWMTHIFSLPDFGQHEVRQFRLWNDYYQFPFRQFLFPYYVYLLWAIPTEFYSLWRISYQLNDLLTRNQRWGSHRRVEVWTRPEHWSKRSRLSFSRSRARFSISSTFCSSVTVSQIFFSLLVFTFLGSEFFIVAFQNPFVWAKKRSNNILDLFLFEKTISFTCYSS